MHPREPLTQRELARATGTDEGHTSRVTGKLLEDDPIVRTDTGAVRSRATDMLLDAWWEVYDFGKHQIVRGHIAARSGEALLHPTHAAAPDTPLPGVRHGNGADCAGDVVPARAGSHPALAEYRCARWPAVAP